MKVPRSPHRWSVTPRQAIAIQKRFASHVLHTPMDRPVHYVAGLDMAFSPDGSRCLAGVVLWDVNEQATVESHVVTRPVTFPYVPGLLSFREAPAVIAALRRLRRTPDCLMCDGQGLAHPRRFGIACHVGVLVDLPTVGCAKSRLTGEHNEPERKRGSRTPLRDGGETIGAVLRTRDGVKPVFVSIGHRIDLSGSVRIVLDCSAGYRIPEPTRLADRLVAAAKRALSAQPSQAPAGTPRRPGD